ncbi:MAG: zinc ribbon domain-containing protein [Butyrivibrio sp.]|nr:zinc ribbon domain-containing protein [Acetatifactor muris]MCM1558812.1 zinc ribbon domain-containing protein [Butyrivibrio sp.]
MICPECGKEISESALFCRYCGISVTAAGEPADAPTKSLQNTEASAAEKSTSGKKRQVRQAFVSLLLFFIFAGGLAVSGRFMYSAWREYHTPYREDVFAALDEELAKRAGSGHKVTVLDELLKTKDQEIRTLGANLARYHLRREREILNTVTDSVEIDYDALFATEFFSSAYLQYIEDLLSAFRQDALTDSWLYTYYDYSVNYGANARINQDLWFYAHDAADEKFSGLLDPGRFCASVYTDTLSEHFALNEHLYVTGLDLLAILGIPGYILDDAVFVKAYGGSLYPAEMEVPGWSQQDYNDFWESAGSPSDSAYAFWTDYGLSAPDFDIDWDALVDEPAYYKAYETFMDTVAPGLERYDMVQYFPDDDYYGGVRYELSGTEASLRKIAAAYITAHPDFLEELGINTEALPSSYDDLIAEAELQLAELTDTADDLTLQKNEAEWLRDSKAFFLQQRETLLAMETRHRELAIRALWIFALIIVFLFLMAAVSLRRFIRALR